MRTSCCLSDEAQERIRDRERQGQPFGSSPHPRNRERAPDEHSPPPRRSPRVGGCATDRHSLRDGRILTFSFRPLPLRENAKVRALLLVEPVQVEEQLVHLVEQASLHVTIKHGKRSQVFLRNRRALISLSEPCRQRPLHTCRLLATERQADVGFATPQDKRTSLYRGRIELLEER